MSSTGVTEIPKDSMYFCVPPVEIIWTLCSFKANTNSSNPSFEKTEMSADFICFDSDN